MGYSNQRDHQVPAVQGQCEFGIVFHIALRNMKAKMAFLQEMSKTAPTVQENH